MNDTWFIYSLGHSGTHFLHKIIANEIGDENVAHQPGTPIDVKGLHEVNFEFEPYRFPINRTPYEDETLSRKIKEHHPQADVVVGPPFTEFMYKTYPDANHAWLYRNGIDVVRAHLTHHLYDDRSIGGMSWFEWGCRRWACMYNKISRIEQKTDVTRIKFEELIKGNCVEEISQIIDIYDYDTEPENPTPGDRKEKIKMPDEWSQERWNTFWKYCGEMMKYLGYEHRSEIEEKYGVEITV